MTSGIAIILHGPADTAYATELAEALSPILAFPVALQSGAERPVQYGSGAVCIALWTQDAAARGLASEVARVMHGAVSSALVCRIGSAPLPDEFSGNACIQVQQQAGARELGVSLGEAIARTAERNTRPRRSATPSLGANRTTSPGREGSGRIAVRSAWGLAATMAVVGVAAPVVGGRAGAANVTPDHTAAPTEAAVVTVRAAALAAQSGRSRDQLNTTVQQPAPEERAAVTAPEEFQLAAGPEASATIALDAQELRSGTSEAIATMVGAADGTGSKFEAVAPTREEKPVAAHRSPKSGAGA